MHYLILDILLNIVHGALVIFILGGVFFKKTERIHFFVVMAVWASWLGLGIYYEHLGYCPLTDWHWKVKMLRGETLLPPSYIEYIYTKITGEDLNNLLVQVVTAIVTLAVTIISTVKYLRFRAS